MLQRASEYFRVLYSASEFQSRPIDTVQIFFLLTNFSVRLWIFLTELHIGMSTTKTFVDNFFFLSTKIFVDNKGKLSTKILEYSRLLIQMKSNLFSSFLKKMHAKSTKRRSYHH